MPFDPISLLCLVKGKVPVQELVQLLELVPVVVQVLG